MSGTLDGFVKELMSGICRAMNVERYVKEKKHFTYYTGTEKTIVLVILIES